MARVYHGFFFEIEFEREFNVKVFITKKNHEEISLYQGRNKK